MEWDNIQNKIDQGCGVFRKLSYWNCNKCDGEKQLKFLYTWDFNLYQVLNIFQHYNTGQVGRKIIIMSEHAITCIVSYDREKLITGDQYITHQ